MPKQADAALLPPQLMSAGTGPVRQRRPEWVAHLPPCNAACPAGENIQAWLGEAQAGRWEAAWRRLLDDNPFPGIHGRACYHPCETACNRAELDTAVAIHAVERHVGEIARERGWKVERAEAQPHRVLVVGAGPAGLSCAYHLARRGVGVEVREALDEPGGMMRWGIPAYRLPRDVVSDEIARLGDLRVVIKCGHRVTDVVAEQKAGGFHAVFLAVGAQIANHLDVPAIDGKRLIDALTLLEETANGGPPLLGRAVGVVGGGDTAVDAARVARRLGAEEAVLIYRRDRPHMSAHEAELEEALAEGVKLRWLSVPRGFGAEGVKVEAVELDPDGAPRPTGRLETLPADILVLAVGEHSDLEFLRGLSGVEITADGVVSIDGQCMTGHHGVFAGGDMTGGARNMTAAVGMGKRAARAIEAFLDGVRYEPAPKHPPIAFEALALPVLLESLRAREPELPASDRSSFSEVVQGLGAEEAAAEAGRCLSCGNCFECDACFAACPEQAIERLGRGRGYRLDGDLCTGCGVCAEQCPCHAIELQPELSGPVVAIGSLSEPVVPTGFRLRS